MKKVTRFTAILLMSALFLGAGCSNDTDTPEKIDNSGIEQETPDSGKKEDETEKPGTGGTGTESENYVLDSVPSCSISYSSTENKYFVKVKYTWNYEYKDYKVFRAESENGPYEELYTFKSSYTFYTDTTVENGKSYWYKLTAVKISDDKTYTSEAVRWDHFSFKVYKKQDLTLKTGFSSITLSWEADPEADGYTVFLNEYSSFRDSYVIQKGETSDTTYTFKNITPESSFYVGVFPKKGAIESERLEDCLVRSLISLDVKVEKVVATDKTATFSVKTNIEEDCELVESIKYELRGSKVNDSTSPFYDTTATFASVTNNSSACDIELDYYEQTKDLAYYCSQWFKAYATVTYKDSQGESASCENYSSAEFYNKLPAPTDVIVTPGRNSIDVDFTSACGSTAKYKYSLSPEPVKYIACAFDAEGNLVKESSAATASPLKITGLDYETEYTVKVTPVLGIFGTGNNTADQYRNYADGGTVTTGKPMDLPSFKSVALEDGYVVAEINPIGDENESIIYGLEYQTLMTETPSTKLLGKDVTVCTKDNSVLLTRGNSYFVRIYAYVEGNTREKFYSDYVTLQAASVEPLGCDTALRFAADGDVIDIIDPATWADEKTPRSVNGKYNIGFINLCGEGSTLSAAPVQTTESTKKYIVRFGLTEEMLKSEKPIRIIVVDATSTIGDNMGVINSSSGCKIINVTNNYSSPSSVALTKVGILEDSGTYSSITTAGPDKAGFEVKSSQIYNNSVYLQVEVPTIGTTGGLGFSYYY